MNTGVDPIIRLLTRTSKRKCGISEALDPRKPVFVGHHDFVGLGGVSPIVGFIEYILGIDVNAPQKTVVWYLHRTERHGLLHLKGWSLLRGPPLRGTGDGGCTVPPDGDECGRVRATDLVRKKVLNRRIQKGDGHPVG
jgi:hypothetical protein